MQLYRLCLSRVEVSWWDDVAINFSLCPPVSTPESLFRGAHLSAKTRVSRCSLLGSRRIRFPLGERDYTFHPHLKELGPPEWQYCHAGSHMLQFCLTYRTKNAPCTVQLVSHLPISARIIAACVCSFGYWNHSAKTPIPHVWLAPLQ